MHFISPMSNISLTASETENTVMDFLSETMTQTSITLKCILRNIWYTIAQITPVFVSIIYCILEIMLDFKYLI